MTIRGIGEPSPGRRQRLLVATTGGTIDSEWDPAADTAVPAKSSAIPEYLRGIGIPYAIEHGDVAASELGPGDGLDAAPGDAEPRTVDVVAQALGVPGEAIGVELELEAGHSPSMPRTPATAQRPAATIPSRLGHGPGCDTWSPSQPA